MNRKITIRFNLDKATSMIGVSAAELWRRMKIVKAATGAEFVCDFDLSGPFQANNPADAVSQGAIQALFTGDF